MSSMHEYGLGETEELKLLFLLSCYILLLLERSSCNAIFSWNHMYRIFFCEIKTLLSLSLFVPLISLSLVTSSAKSCLVEEQILQVILNWNVQRLIRAYATFHSWTSTAKIFVAPCAVSASINYQKHVKTANQGGHCLFLHKACFYRWHHIH